MSASHPAATASGPPTTSTPARPIVLLLAVAALYSVLAVTLVFVHPTQRTTVFASGYLAVDATSQLFLALIDLIFLGIASYVANRVRAIPELLPGLDRFVWLAIGFISASNLAVLSHHLLFGWIFLEATTLLATPLIRHRTGARGLQASWTYFLFSCVGLAITLLGFACIARGVESTGAHEASFFIDSATTAARHPADLWRQLGLALVFLGYGTKLGLAPMYAWLPETYEASPPAVTGHSPPASISTSPGSEGSISRSVTGPPLARRPRTGAASASSRSSSPATEASASARSAPTTSRSRPSRGCKGASAATRGAP